MIFQEYLTYKKSLMIFRIEYFFFLVEISLNSKGTLKSTNCQLFNKVFFHFLPFVYRVKLPNEYLFRLKITEYFLPLSLLKTEIEIFNFLENFVDNLYIRTGRHNHKYKDWLEVQKWPFLAVLLQIISILIVLFGITIF